MRSSNLKAHGMPWAFFYSSFGIGVTDSTHLSGFFITKKPPLTTLKEATCIPKMLGAYGLHTGDFDFESAEVGVEILADAVGNIDVRALGEAEFC